MLDLGQKFLVAQNRMTEDRSSSAYVARIRSQNIIASVANGIRGGIGFRGSLLLGQIVAILNAPPQVVTNVSILAPTDLSGSVSGNGDVVLTWTNRASGIIDTLVEKNLSDGNGWVTINHPTLGTGNSLSVQFFNNGFFRVSSVTATGTSVPSTSLYFESVMS